VNQFHQIIYLLVVLDISTTFMSTLVEYTPEYTPGQALFYVNSVTMFL